MALYLKNKTTLKDLIYSYYLALIPLIIYGFYKNIVLLKQFHLLSFYSAVKPLLILATALFIGFLSEFIYHKFWVKDNFSNYNPFIPLSCLIGAMILPAHINLLICSITLFLYLFIIKILKLDNKINIMVFLVLLFILVFQLFNLSSFAIGKENLLNLDFWDIVWGRSVGGTFTTSNIWLIVSYVILSWNEIYKKEIPFYIIISHLALLGIFTLITNNYELWPLFFSGFPLFASIFIAPYTYTSCYTKKGKILMSILIGGISFILTLIFKWYMAIFIAIALGSFFGNFVEKHPKIPKKC